ncbi:MAG: S41 family peptidase [Lachnospiraceae bacterium]|nr:S41 family peptidase [Lachnospiraceae bacterium]
MTGLILGFVLAAGVVVILLILWRGAYKRLLSNGATVNGSYGFTGELVNDKMVSKLRTLEYLVDKYYLNEYTVEDMREGVYEGLIDSLGDRYGEYYTKEELKEAKEKSSGTFGGIGAYIGYDQNNNCCVIAGTFTDSPAEKAGLREGDLIYMVDGEDVSAMDTNEVVSRVRGPEGSTVHMSLVRQGSDDLIEVDIVREQIESDTVYSEMLEDNIGYIQIEEFDTVTFEQFVDALAVLKGQGAKGIIIDVRSNPGGNLDTACDIARYIIPEGIICYTVDKYDNRIDYTSDGEHELELPLVMLVNGYSASASEILTGAAKDHGKARVVGSTTYGKGIVQTIVPIDDGSAVKLTTCAYYTPSGVCIHGTGIEPDVAVDFNSDEYYNEGKDNQLDAAVEEMHKLWEETK